VSLFQMEAEKLPEEFDAVILGTGNFVSSN